LVNPTPLRLALLTNVSQAVFLASPPRDYIPPLPRLAYSPTEVRGLVFFITLGLMFRACEDL
jgi:hypothetical protein